MDWTPPPEPISWPLPKPLVFGQASWQSITVRAPTAGDLLKAQAIQGQSNLAFTLRLIAELSMEGIQYEALAQPGPNGVPQYIIEQITNYLDLFGGAPLPSPLEDWRRETAAKVAAEVEAEKAKAPSAGSSGQTEATPGT